MKRYLSLISIMLAIAFSVTAQDQQLCKSPFMWPLENDAMVSYRAAIQARGHQLTGIIYQKPMSHDTLNCVLMNEFGIVALSYQVINKGKKTKVKLIEMLPMIDKWYIKKILKSDLRHLYSFHQDVVGMKYKHRIIQQADEEGVKMLNCRYDIHYHLIKIREEVEP